ncbi:MAG: TonB family protein [Deltaproteobacteria bacterium]|nr:TonB family protein [Deltaproteobacteria bacterium]
MTKKPKVFPKPKPKKVIKEVIQKAEKDLSKAIPEKTVESPKTFDLPEQAQGESVFKETNTEGEPLSEKQIIREARPLYRSNPPPKYLHVLFSSGYPILDRAAKSSVKNWTFEPGMRGQEKVEMWVRVPIRFELK